MKKKSNRNRQYTETSSIFQQFDIILILVFPLLAAVLSELWHLSYIASTLLFFGVPSVYISIRRPLLIKKTLIFSAIALIGFIIVDYLTYLDLTRWVVNSQLRLMKNGLAIEDIPWAFLWVYYAVVFWEYFLDHDRVKVHLDHHFRYLMAIIACLLVLFFAAVWLKPEALTQNFLYLKLGIVLIVIPITAVLAKFPHLIRKILIIAAYFFMVNLLWEFTGLRQYHWAYTGKQFIDSFSWMGFKLPLEQVVFYWILGVPALICWYEFFADDRK